MRKNELIKYINVFIVLLLMFTLYKGYALQDERDDLWCELNCDPHTFTMHEEREAKWGNSLWKHTFADVSSGAKMVIVWNYINIDGTAEMTIYALDTKIQTGAINGSIELQTEGSIFDVVIYVNINGQRLTGIYYLDLFVWL